MRRLARILGCAAALLLGAAVLGCPWFHGSYPSSSNTCESTSDCLMGEICSDGGVCERAAVLDAGTDDASDGGGHAG